MIVVVGEGVAGEKGREGRRSEGEAEEEGEEGLWSGGVARRGGDATGSLNICARTREQGTRGVWPPALACSCHIEISFPSLFHRNLPLFGPTVGVSPGA